jgi:hypoxanthine phosphoribosyltransferase
MNPTERMGWSDFEDEIDKLADKIQAGDTTYDALVGITRGGVIPARLLVARLAIDDMYCINVRKQGVRRVVTTPITEDLTDKHVLIVEDVLESGRSLDIAKEYLEQEKRAHVGTAALYFMDITEASVDYSLKKVESPPYFPWEPEG